MDHKQNVPADTGHTQLAPEEGSQDKPHRAKKPTTHPVYHPLIGMAPPKKAIVFDGRVILPSDQSGFQSAAAAAS